MQLGYRRSGVPVVSGLLAGALPGATRLPTACSSCRLHHQGHRHEWRRHVELTRRLPRYPPIPTTVLGRLAVDQRFPGQGNDRFMLADALLRAVRSEIASFAVIVDAKDNAARRFYERESFLPFADERMKLFRTTAELVKLFDRVF